MSGYQESRTLDDARLANPTISTDPKKTLTQSQLKKILKYNPTTGDFFWISPTANRMKKGDMAGGKSKDGYTRIKIRGVSMLSHRLAWLYMEGYLPTGIEVDHIDKNPMNNSWENLRIVSHKCNSRNAKISKNNTSGVTGVWFCKKSKRWIAKIVVDFKPIHLGRFKNKKDAVATRWRAEVEHGFPGCNTTSSALEYLNRTAA